MIVVDTNVLASLFLETEASADAQAALARDAGWAAPLLWRSELRNVLATHVRLGLYDLAHCLEVLEAAEDVLGDRQLEIPDSKVLRLAESSGCSAYDCEFVALAEHLELPLVTLDGKVLKSFPERAVPLAVFAGGSPS